MTLTFSQDEKQSLLTVAEASVCCGLVRGSPLELIVAEFSPALRAPRASFVTLRIAGQLRGCMGTIRAFEPLVADVARNAFSSAFRDPRFSAVTPDEVGQLEFHVSVLTDSVALEFESEADLLAKIRPGIDGLTLLEGNRKGTLLPAVWQNLADPREFLMHLKRKAGLPPEYWSSTICVERYEAISIGREDDPPSELQ